MDTSKSITEESPEEIINDSMPEEKNIVEAEIIEAEATEKTEAEQIVSAEETKIQEVPKQAKKAFLLQKQQQQLNFLESFEMSYRMGKAYARTSLVPKAYQDRPEDCAVAIDMALRVGLHPLMVMQNMYVVQGKPSWSGQACIALMRNNYKDVKKHFVGNPDTDDWGCYYTAVDSNGEEIKGSTVTIKMAKKEGWYGKSGSKWQSMPEQMLTYRAAAFFVRANCPEILMGCSVEGEPEDIAASKTGTKQYEDKQYRCADCGKPFKAVTIQKNDGTLQDLTAKEIYEMSASKNKDGVARCSMCMKKGENNE